MELTHLHIKSDLDVAGSASAESCIAVIGSRERMETGPWALNAVKGVPMMVGDRICDAFNRSWGHLLVGVSALTPFRKLSH